MTLLDYLTEAAHSGASDLFLVTGAPVSVKVEGVLRPLEEERIVPSRGEALVKELYTLAQRSSTTFMQTGDDDFSFSVAGLARFRVNTYRQRGSVAAVIRVVAFSIPDYRTLNIPSEVISLADYTSGMVLVTGTAGCGKSTTLACLVDRINQQRACHIITLEDPIEYLHRHDMSIVNQREIGLDSQSYANALRAALREDPDVILVGEMRDFDTISVAITAAETGHLVLSTLHTIGAASTVDRVIDVFPPHQQQQIRIQFANILEAVISQQLIPTADGKSRVAAFEVMHANHAVRNLIREGKSHQLPSVMQTNRKIGMITMDEAILQLYFEGRISKDMAIQFATDPDGMAQKLQ